MIKKYNIRKDYYETDKTFLEDFLKRESVSIDIPVGTESIRDYAFYNFSNLENITIPNTVSSIGKFAFSNCSSLTSIVIPDSVTSLPGSILKGCDNLESVKIPFIGENKDSLENFDTFGHLFGSRYSDHYRYIPSSLKYVEITGGDAIQQRSFYDCLYIETININFSPSYVGYAAFWNCSSLKTLEIPDSVERHAEDVFGNNSALEELTIPYPGNNINSSPTPGAPSSERNFKCWFLGDFPSSLKKVTFKNHNLVPYESGGSPSTWFGSSCISNTNIEEIVIDIERSITFEGYCFANCETLSKLTISDGQYGFRFWESSIFSNTPNLKEIHFLGTIERWNKNINRGSSSWNSGSSIEKIICSDGEVTL